MLTTLFFAVFVGIATAEHGWRPGTEYSYTVRGRTVTGLNQISNQFTGVLMQAKLNIQAKSDSTLSLRISGAEYSEIHRNLSNGWDTYIADKSLNYTNLHLHDEPFELYLDDGIIKEMTVDQSIPSWELNILKSIASLLQVNTQAGNAGGPRKNQVPKLDPNLNVYKTMEDSVIGVYETVYDICEIPEYVLLSRPELLPLPHLVGDGKVFEIVKNRNLASSNQRTVYHSGLDGQPTWKPGSNKMGNFLSRTSISQIIVSGNLRQYTIQSSTTTDKIIVAPHLYNKQKGMVGSRFNLTLQSVNSIKLPFPVISNPRPIRNLVYEYNPNASRNKDTGKRMNGGLSEHKLDGSIDSSDLFFSSLSNEREFMTSDKFIKLPATKLSDASPLDYVTFTNEKKYDHDILNSTENVVRLALEIGQGIVLPNPLTGEQTLNKFSLLVRLIRTMSTNQLREVSEILYYPYSKTKKANSLDVAHNYQAWISFRDAVGQSGTGPALMTIREWIVSNKIAGEEISYLIMSLPESAKNPTADYMDYFFDMLNDKVIKNHVSLRTSAVLSFTDLVRKAVAVHRMSQKYYHMDQTKNDSAILEKYITYFQKQLQESVEQKNSLNIQLYIRALNNIAHPYILKVFKPYLEGKTPISKFQRFTIIASMDKIVKLYPNLVRTVLFRIYNNIADTPEIRIAAVMQFMKTNPPALMLQSMAEQTNFDKNNQVNAAVKSALESIAEQEINQYNKDMVQKARAAVNLLIPKNYGVHNSRNFINSYIVKERNLAYKHHLTYIQSSDSIYPSSIFYNLKNNLGGYKANSYEMNFMSSSTSKLIDLLYDGLIHTDMNHKREKRINLSTSKWSLNNIYNSLNFEKEEDEQLEGQILGTLLGVKRYFSFDRNTIKNIPKNVAAVVKNMIDNNRFNFTKLYNQYSFEVVFPTAMGIPFIYTLETPTLVNLGIQLTRGGHSTSHNNHSSDQSDNVGVAGNHNLLYSSYSKGKIGFITPYNGKIYSAGLEKNIYVHIPIKMDINLNLKQSKISATLEPIEKNNIQKLFEYSTRAFTSVKDSSKLNSLKSMKGRQLVYNEPIRVVQQTFGKDKHGFSFDVKMETDKKILDLKYIYDHLKGHDMVSLASFVDLLDEINNHNYTITFDPRSSWSKSMKLSLSYNKTESKPKGTPGSSDFSSYSGENYDASWLDNNESYQKEVFKNVAINIKDAQTNFIQLKTEFKGDYETEYEVIFASSNSYASNITRILAFMKNSTTTQMEPKTYTGALEVTTMMPKISLVKYGISSNVLSPSKVKGRFIFGEQPPFENRIMLEGDFYTSEERLNYLKKHPLVVLCEEQIQKGYEIQPVCRNVTRRMNYLDNYQFRINHEHISNDFKNTVHMIYRHINNLWYDYNTGAVDFQKNGETIDVEVKFGNNFLTSNLSIITPDFSDKYVNVPIHEWVRPLVVLHPQHSLMDRLGHKLLVAQESPTCTYDKDQITTFDNSTYYVNLGDKYHILTQYISKEDGFKTIENKDEYFSIIVGQRPSQLLDLSIIVGDDVLEVRQEDDSSLNFIYNGKKIVISDDIKELHDYSGQLIFKLTSLSKDAVKIAAEKHGFEIIHHRNHIAIVLSNKFRNKLRGLCGNFDGESFNEFITPQNCIKNDSEEFIASYGFHYKNIKGVKKYPKKHNTECYRQQYLFETVVNEEEVDKYIGRKRKVNYEETIKNRLLKEMIEASTTYHP